ncbi:tRNA epoxyqueuosine(34) reductase QueG [Tepidimicrobium xylanilyticum]|uniref:Epoxyqueuosine reductase n=1 Tax=Tepidimicrobium xylanilyticum TaxID=1123352 RepID=A0A1H2ZYR8_9FIRM|nr:tRNA epoxyqueuosine(34) reductase QueG [Tepidimicrobium xylanilyticum]SDX22118.1 epoxyqueuosine reductase [Tepidimicrobium xylanilyticum]
MNLKQFIVDKSKALNIDLIGFTDCEPLFDLEDYLVLRQRKSMETEFEEKDLKKRINPKLIFPACKTIIVIGLSYNVDYNENPDYDLKGILSKSSWGLDYHRVLKDKFEQLIAEIKRIKDFEYKYYVDTGPLIDRELANRAGIGYYGKNCSIINDEYGSFIFIGYMLTNLELDVEHSKKESKCGNCSLCIDYCPTKALERPYRVNPKKCISYLTQTKNWIPYELRDKMGVKIYGCDTCQKVCPKNNGVKKSYHEEFIPWTTMGYINIEELLCISNKQFKARYGDMAGSWRGKNILKRNGIIALANMKDKGNIKLLEPLLKDPNPMIRECAAWAIQKLDCNYGKAVIEKRIRIENDEDTKKKMRNLLNNFLTNL